KAQAKAKNLKDRHQKEHQRVQGLKKALGEARAAEYYNDAAHSLRTSATRWGPGLVLLTGLAALLWNWYNQLPKLYLFGTIVVLFVASLYPTYVMQLPRAAISPLMKLV
ncbi:MAG: hypothetical protein HN879_09640, partial [Flavobacteriaceae bacterium]|nr:hypothetical protein [Flavobacteriaceae bacterium]